MIFFANKKKVPREDRATRAERLARREGTTLARRKIFIDSRPVANDTSTSDNITWKRRNGSYGNGLRIENRSRAAARGNGNGEPKQYLAAM